VTQTAAYAPIESESDADREAREAAFEAEWQEEQNEIDLLLKEDAVRLSKWTERTGLTESDRRLLIAMKEWREKEDQPLYQLKMLATAVPRFGKEWWLISTEL